MNVRIAGRICNAARSRPRSRFAALFVGGALRRSLERGATGRWAVRRAESARNPRLGRAMKPNRDEAKSARASSTL